MAGIIIGGWDEVVGPSVYSIPLGGSLHKRPFAIGGSGSSFIYGYCDANFRVDMTRDDAIQFTKNGSYILMQLFLWQCLAMVLLGVLFV
jgi:20S proteasome subunit beta 1